MDEALCGLRSNTAGERIWRWLRPLPLVAACAAAAPALAQPHETTRQGFTLRSSTVASRNLDPATARRHGISPSPTRGVLNVVVLRKQGGSPRTVRADVRATARNLTGIENDIPMREVEQNGYISYVGSYRFAPREVVDFQIEARPRGSDTTLTLRYRDRLWRTR